MVPSANGPCSARASIRKLSSSVSARSRSLRRPASSAWVCAGTPSGLAIATSSRVRIIANGVRSSCEALATNPRCASNAASKRASSSSIVSASSRSSSRGPGQREPLVQALLGDPLRPGRDRPQWREHPARDHPAQRDRDRRHHRQRDPRLDQQVVQVGPVLVAQRDSDLTDVDGAAGSGQARASGRLPLSERNRRQRAWGQRRVVWRTSR